VCRYPKNSHPYGLYSVDESVLERYIPTKDEVSAIMATPAYERGWPTCEGKCYQGNCALRWDHPTCCAVSRGDGKGAYSQSAATTQYRDDGDLLCWKH